MVYVPQQDDPFAGGKKVPSLSWKGLPIGTVFTCQVLEPAKLLQSRNFETGQPEFWDEGKTQPVMSAVVNVLVTEGPHSVGEERSIWAQKPSDLFVAIADAQKAAEARIDTGGILQIKFVGETPHKNPRNNPIKNYRARYTPPSPDAFDEPEMPQGRAMASWGTPQQQQHATPAQQPARKGMF